jgi:septin family protein
LVTVRELTAIREYLSSDFQSLGLELYDFSDDEVEKGDKVVALKSVVPFCLVNSEEWFSMPGAQRAMGIMIGDKKVLGREFIWGTIDVQNPEHCDFELLKSILFDTHIDEFRDKTREWFYEQWRTQNLRTKRKSILLPADLQSLAVEEVEE